ncbi:hypothetical protein GIB67_040276 [Kingdonia uniflora]|uniref:Uncharacterized protein n=1 Tax=Kingdonia uniflora TaxID=39325 RepID=A0A7J7MVD7_9MAGN|nr:hypothetical protein GIB67_040276 [Kingdonia uniflora]
MATYMVLRIMKNNSKKQKLSTKDHVSHEDESKTSKDGVESCENDVQVLEGCCINDQHYVSKSLRRQRKRMGMLPEVQPPTLEERNDLKLLKRIDFQALY